MTEYRFSHRVYIVVYDGPQDRSDRNPPVRVCLGDRLVLALVYSGTKADLDLQASELINVTKDLVDEGQEVCL